MEAGTILESLPERLTFYHRGEVLRVPAEPGSEDRLETAFERRDVVAVNLSGDVSGTLLVAFEPTDALSEMLELGNVLASHLATNLSRDGLDVMIGPPAFPSPARLATFLKVIGNFRSRKEVTRCHFVFNTADEKRKAVEALFVSAPMEGAVHDQTAGHTT